MRYLLLLIFFAGLGLSSCCVIESNNIGKQNRVIVAPHAAVQNLKPIR